MQIASTILKRRRHSRFLSDTVRKMRHYAAQFNSVKGKQLKIMHLHKLILLIMITGGLALWGTANANNVPLILKKHLSKEPINKAKVLVAMAKQHEHAEGVPRDYNRAMELYCKAAEQGYDEALYSLGWMYANGRGVSRNDGIAVQLFTLAAEKGHSQANTMVRYLETAQEPELPDCLQSIANTSTVDYSDKPFFDLVLKLAPEYNLDPNLVMAIIAVESAFNEQAVSHKNAQGLMQLIPATAERFAVKNIFDAEENIRGGMAYLRWLLAFFKGDVTLAVAAYNAGEGAVEKYQGIPPFTETQNYVKKIQAQYAQLTHPYEPDIVHRHAVIALSEYK